MTPSITSRLARTARACVVLAPLALIATGGCAMNSVDDDEGTLASTKDALSLSHWSSLMTVPNQYATLGGATATLNGTTYMVHSGGCPSCTDLYWSKLGGGGWTDDVRIPGQLSGALVSLVAFNGRLYLAHTGSSTSSTQLWFSSFNPATSTWTDDYEIPFPSRGAPGMAVYGGKLYMIGSAASDARLWMASMSTSETWTPMTMLSDYSLSAPSLAVLNGRLYMAHATTSDETIVYNFFDGTSWVGNRRIPGGRNGLNQRGTPRIAAWDGYLHVVHNEPGTTYETMYWTYFDGSAWSAEVSIPNHYSKKFTLSTTGAGLMLVQAPTYAPYTLYYTEYR
jgi:hypothetical protein